MIDVKLLMRKKDELLRERGRILDKITEENRPYNSSERSKTKDLREQVDSYDEQIKEAQEIENRRAGIPPNQPRAGMPDGDPMPGLAMPRIAAENRGFTSHDYTTGHRNFGEFVQDIRFPAEFQAKTRI